VNTDGFFFAATEGAQTDDIASVRWDDDPFPPTEEHERANFVFGFLD
jgi:hypothetical protein